MNNKLYIYLNEQFMETNITSDDVIEKDKEIERLQNIIDELEKYIKENYVIDESIKFKNDLLDKLKALKDNKDELDKIAVYQVILGDLDKLKELKEE